MTTREEYERAAATGDIDAMHDFGRYLERATPPDITGARDWYGRAATGGHRCAISDLGRLAEHENPPDLTTAREWYERGAATGDPGAMYNLAGLLADRTTPPDLVRARGWYERAATAEYTDAYFTLAYLLAERLDPPDPAAALPWYEKAAEQGDSAAMYNVGQLYRYTLEPRDPAAARRWYGRAAAEGYSNAIFTLGLMSEADNDIPDALLWYEKAAAKGHAGAMNNLGTLYEAKVHTPNLPAATEWYERAALADNANAKTNLARLRGSGEAAAPARPRAERTVLPDRVARTAGTARPQSATDTSGIAAALDALIEDNPYQHNPFRLAGLNTDANSREIRKRVTELEAAEKLGAPLPRTTALAVTPPPDAADVKAALNRLREPVNRLVQELFWLWPCADPDPAAAALSRNDTDTAERIWLCRIREDAIAAHNIAVLRHIQGLETPRGQAPETWLDALTAWDCAIGDDAVWERLRARASHIDDRRLDSAVEELRSALPATLLRIQAARIVRATADDDFAAADLHIDVLDRFAEQVRTHPGAFDTAAIDDARGWAIRKLAARLKSIADEAHRTGAQRPAEADRAADRMLDRARVPLRVIDRLRPPSDPLGAGAHDDIVSTAIFCDIQHYNETRDVAASVAMLERLGPIATTTAIRDRLTGEWAATAVLQVDKFCAAARESAEGNRNRGLQAARDLLDRTLLPLARIRAGNDPDGEPATRAQDHIATTATSCVVGYCNDTGDLESTEQVLNRIQPLPVGAEARTFVQEQITVLAGMLRERNDALRLRNTCWFCRARPAAAGQHHRFGLHRDVVRSGNTKRWKTLTVEVPRCERCRQVHLPEETKRKNLGTAVALGYLAAFVTFLIGVAAHPVLIVAAICLILSVVGSMAQYSMGDEIRDRASTYPPLVDLLGQGWKKGERPA